MRMRAAKKDVAEMFHVQHFETVTGSLINIPLKTLHCWTYLTLTAKFTANLVNGNYYFNDY